MKCEVACKKDSFTRDFVIPLSWDFETWLNETRFTCYAKKLPFLATIIATDRISKNEGTLRLQECFERELECQVSSETVTVDRKQNIFVTRKDTQKIKSKEPACYNI